MVQARSRNRVGKLVNSRVSRHEEAVLSKGGTRVESFLYNHSVDGGAVGDYRSNRYLPAGAIIVAIRADIHTSVTGADAVTVKVGSQSLTAAVDFTALSGIASVALTDVDGVKLSSEGELKISVATNAATAGKFRLYVQYFIPQD